MDKVLAIVGPTGSGKSALAVAAAKRFNGEVISADSMQVYRKMDIGTAKITPPEMDGVIHHLIDVCEIDEPWNVQRFAKLSRMAIEEIRKKGKLPILCGGTGLYLKAAVYDYEFEQEDPQKEQKMKELEAKSNEELVALLEKKDPACLKKIHPNNRKRLLRAAYMAGTSKTKSERENEQRHQPRYDLLTIGIRAEREAEVCRINERVDRMFEQGLPEEVRSLFSDPKMRKCGSFQAIGYKEFSRWLDQEESLETVKEQIKIHTRQYARRQMTWFANQMPVCWFRPDQKDAVFDEIEQWLLNNGKYSQTG